MAEYSRSRALVPAAAAVNVMVTTVLLPVAPVALAPLKSNMPGPSTAGIDVTGETSPDPRVAAVSKHGRVPIQRAGETPQCVIRRTDAGHIDVDGYHDLLADARRTRWMASPPTPRCCVACVQLGVEGGVCRKGVGRTVSVGACPLPAAVFQPLNV